MNHTFEILEFNKIVEHLKELAYTEAAKEKFAQLEPYLSETELDHSLRETTEARKILDVAGMPPLTSLTDIDRLIRMAEQGNFLTPEQLEQIESNLASTKRMKDFLSRLKYLDSGLPYYEADLSCMEELREEILTKIVRGRVDDYASNLLKNVRRQIGIIEEKRKVKAESILRSKKEYFSEGFITIKNGRICLPVKKDCRSKIEGAVIDKSSTGQTVFIEPASVARMGAELEALLLEEENEERRILYMLSDMVSEHKESFETNSRIIAKLDFIFAKGRLSCEMDGVRPEITMERKIEIRKGRHPFIDKEACVPLDFKMGGEIKGIIITGPNTGGKTVSIKTVGLLSLMAQCGLHVPCESGEFAMFNEILCDIGDGQNITENLSTFSAHITNTLDILKRAGHDSLVIMDELGSGTDPAEGMGIAVAILEELRACSCLFLVTTHYPEVKAYARNTEGVLNARMAFDRKLLSPLYRMEIGEAGESCAFFIAEHLGMPEDMIRIAKQAAYGNKGMEKEAAGHWDSRSAEKAGRRRDAKRAIMNKEHTPRLIKKKEQKDSLNPELFQIGDSVLILPEKRIGIVCKKINEKGVLQVQIPGKKIWINHKRVKLHVKAAELYPDNYDFSILFDTVEERKARHQMGRKYSPGLELRTEEPGRE